MKKLLGNSDIEDSLEKLNKLTQEEARMAHGELLKVTHSVEGEVMGIDSKVKGVDDRIKDVGENVRDIHGEVQDVGNRVQGIDESVQAVQSDVKALVTVCESLAVTKYISSEVRDVHDKLDEVKRS